MLRAPPHDLSPERAVPRPTISSPADAEAQVASFLAKYTPELAASAVATRARLRARVPGGVEFVYDNYNFLVFGYGPSERPSEAVLSLALAPRWVTLCFLQGATLHDPKHLLKGTGNVVRNVRLTGPAHLDDPDVAALIAQALASADFPGGAPRLVIQSISAKQRSRRP
jgi:hypothetical protein